MPVIAPDESVGLNALSRLARVFEAAVFLAVTFFAGAFFAFSLVGDMGGIIFGLGCLDKV